MLGGLNIPTPVADSSEALNALDRLSDAYDRGQLHESNGIQLQKFQAAIVRDRHLLLIKNIAMSKLTSEDKTVFIEKANKAYTAVPTMETGWQLSEATCYLKNYNTSWIAIMHLFNKAVRQG